MSIQSHRVTTLVTKRSRCQSSICSPRHKTIIPETDKGTIANPVFGVHLVCFQGFQQIIRDDYGHIYEVKRSISEVGFDDDFEISEVLIPNTKCRNKWIPKLRNTRKRLSSIQEFHGCGVKYHPGMEF